MRVPNRLALLGVAAAVLAVIAGLVIHVALRARSDLYDLRAQVSAIDAELARQAKSQPPRPVPAIVGLRAESVGGALAKSLAFDLKPGLDVIGLIADNGIDPSWRFAKDGDLPMPWPQSYRAIYHQDFAPYTFLINARLIANAIGRGGEIEASYRQALPYLMRQLEQYTDVEGDLAFVSYKFNVKAAARTVKAPWRSAFGNAVAMLGLMELGRATDDPAWLAQAEPYLRGILAVDHADGVTKIDEAQYLWFEEYPAPLQHIINGHIATLLALYHYGETTHDDRVRPYLNAALTTMRRYLPSVRRDGRVAAYGMFDLTQPDYGPQRLISFTRTLAAISGDAAFGALAAAFETDMPLPPP